MILLSSDCLIFQLADGASIPLSAEAISIELVSDSAQKLEPEFVRHAAAAVFHYFQKDLQRTTVTVAEFSQALENVLRGFGLTTKTVETNFPGHQADLAQLATESGTNELLFFPRLRDALRHQLQQTPAHARFRGLRPCVKRLAGSRRWSDRCRRLEDQILSYLHQCLRAEAAAPAATLVVE